jgi:small subunit ribosomal protein S18
MARNSKLSTRNRSSRKPTPAEGKGRVRRGRPKVCQFCVARTQWVDYKDINVLRRFVNDRGRIRGRGATGTCSQHQRAVALAIKTARELALLPYTVRTLAPGAGDRRGGPRRDAPSASAATDAAAPTTEAVDTESVTEDPSPQDANPPEDLERAVAVP